ncbi:MAG: cache domain-containing protein, partial [Deltaproteobacteria bacterium]|nr:cache domain-containing protein [Deltaproteobacteria bacterium]
MNRRWIATQLAAILALSGLLPIVGLGALGVAILRRRSEAAAQESLRALAEQASERVRVYLTQQRETLRMIAANLASDAQAVTRLEEIRLDAPSLGPLRMVDPGAPPEKLPPKLTPAQVKSAAEGKEVASSVYLGKDLTPAMDVCLPARGVVKGAICTSLDLLELQRLVQRIHIGEEGYAVALDQSGRLLAAGAPQLRAAVLTGERSAESALVEKSRGGGALPGTFDGGLGVQVVAGWARLDELDWIVVVEQPTSEALAGARAARHYFYIALLVALIISLGVGIWQ